MSLAKFKCSCGSEWYGDESDLLECENAYDDEDDAEHIVKKSTRLSAIDYVHIWGDELEDANRHSLTDMPDEIYEVVSKYVKDKIVIRKIMKELYEREIGI